MWRYCSEHCALWEYIPKCAVAGFGQRILRIAFSDVPNAVTFILMTLTWTAHVAPNAAN